MSEGPRKRIRKSKHASLSESNLAPEHAAKPQRQRPPPLKHQKQLAQIERVAYEDVVETRPDSHGGTGLFAVRQIPEGDLALVYYGQLMTNAQLMKRYPDENGTYVVRSASDPRKFVDGSRVLSLASRVNHSSRRANARLTHYSGLFPILVNTKPIKAGGEILANYSKAYFRRADGTAVDRGFMY